MKTRVLWFLAALALASPAQAVLSIPSNTWVWRQPPAQTGLPGFSGSFDPRGWSHLVYDSLGQRIVIWDGYLDASRPYSIYGNAIWFYDVAANRLTLENVTNWVRSNGRTVPLPENTATPTPYDRHSYSTIAMSPTLNRLFLWAGANNSVPENPFGDLWIYDFTLRAWHVALPVERPQTMFEQAMVWDPSIGKVVLFAGPRSAWQDGDRAWHFDPITETWQDKATSPQPGVRMAQSMAYDRARRGTWMFGGNFYPLGSDELWFYDAAANRWEFVNPSGPKPAPRRFAGMAYDSRRDFVLLWGGIDSNDNGFNDTWIFRPATRTWQQIFPASP
ncbi:MAG TPA: kelch repeat-containing protein, partial [Gemmatimonadaceae bacterium]|nr:kelch repeat-containing protein [Gemmatimonadaceae bacterium]